MHIGGFGGRLFELRVVGYQFPDAAQSERRYSWHMLEGQAADGVESWPLQGPWLTCDETPLVENWLGEAAAFASRYDPPQSLRGAPAPLTFIEPVLGFQLVGRDAGLVLRVLLDLQFLPPSQAGRYAGHPVCLDLSVDEETLLSAAKDWAQQAARYPDLSAR